MWFVGGVVMTKQEIENVIDETIKEIWVNEIADDYESGWLLKEDTLKNSFYYHFEPKWKNCLKIMIFVFLLNLLIINLKIQSIVLMWLLPRLTWIGGVNIGAMM